MDNLIHTKRFTRTGGMFEIIQLWINLPAKFKTAPPRYQTLTRADIPVVELPDDSGALRVIAGEFDGKSGPAQTFTPINLWDVRLRGGHTVDFDVPSGFTTIVFVMSGRITVNGAAAGEAQIVLLEGTGEKIQIEAETDAALLILNGEPIDEPVAWQGPFVMNTRDELRQAIIQYQSGAMGRIEGEI